MAVLQGRTRRQLRQSIGFNIGALQTSTMSATGLTTTAVDNSLTIGGTDEHKGKYLYFTSGANNANLIRRVTASSVTSSITTLTFAPAVTDATANADTYELWGWNGEGLHPQRIHEFINQAIITATGNYFDPVELLSFHGDGTTARFDLPTGITLVNGVYHRKTVAYTVIHNASSAWDESTAPSGVTRSVDTKDTKGSGSNKFVVTAAVAAGQVLSSKAITSLDLSGYDYVEFWIKSNVATAAADLQLLLDNTAAVASPLETLDVPALVANTWTFVRIALANPRLDTAIISVGLEYNVDIGAATIWIEDVEAVLNSSAIWERIPLSMWKIDQEARDLILSSGAVSVISSNLIKVTGGDKPALLSADTDVTEVPDAYIIAQATAWLLLSGSGGSTTDPDARRQAAAYWAGVAERERRNFPFLTDARMVE